MASASEIADWWDEQRRQSSKELERFVDNNPNLFGVIVATSTETAMQLGGGMVDMLRFGEGAAEGGVGGFGKDALRLIGLLGPLGRGGKLFQMSVNARLARLVSDPGGGICGWISGTAAFRQTGTKLFVAVEDLAKALGKTMPELGGSTLVSLVEHFKRIGARIGVIKNISTWEDLVSLTRRDGSVTIFSVFGKRLGDGGVLEDIGHAVYAFRDYLGRLRILDRGGVGKTMKIVESLEELGKPYSLQGSWRLGQAAVMENIFAKFMEGLSNAPTFALAVFGLAAGDEQHHETVAQAFEVSKVVNQQGKKALEVQNPRYHTVIPGDWLSKIAQRYYGNMYKWPVIFETNRDVIGRNPNLIKPGQRFLIPELPIIAAH